MFNNVAADTNIIFYLMIGVGVIGVLAKIVNQITLRRLVKAACNMSKSTHKLMKLVRAKYEHACMIHDKVDNVGAFVEKYIYEYRGFILRCHTWRQLEIQSIWFAGILAVFGGAAQYFTYGMNEIVFQYLAGGAAEMTALFVISQLSDEPYKIKAAKNYMVDYLENVCAHKYKRVKQTEKEKINVIRQESPSIIGKTPAKDNPELSINIEGEPRNVEGATASVEKAGVVRPALRRSIKEKLEEDEQPALKEEAIRQILEEFLA